MSDNRFVLVQTGHGRVTDMDKTRITDLRESNFKRQWNEVNKYFQSQGCEAIIWYEDDNGDWAWDWSRNIPMSHHAEENLFVKQNATTLTVKAALITIEPCRDHRYGNGHNCYQFFKNGRKVLGQLRRFIPADADTPVFYLEDQPAPGTQSKVSRSLARLDPSCRREYVANLVGVRWGLPVQNLSTELWDVGGQEVMTAEEIVGAFKKFFKHKPVAADQWDPQDCAEEVQAEVQEYLTAWASGSE